MSEHISKFRMKHIWQRQYNLQDRTQLANYHGFATQTMSQENLTELPTVHVIKPRNIHSLI